ncbi:hypothetical protein ACFE04_004395 [Oxalis oulophora]
MLCNDKQIAIALVLTLVLFGKMLKAETVDALQPRIRVIMLNAIGPDVTVTINCKSKDDDLGIHVVQPQKTYDFSFKPNIFGSTVFICRVSWKNIVHYFDAYYADLKCKVCPWTLKETGPCYTYSPTKDYCYNWRF